MKGLAELGPNSTPISITFLVGTFTKGLMGFGGLKLELGGGLIHATVLGMSDDQARDLAESICTFEYDVSRAVERYRYDRELRARLDEEMLSIIDATEPVN